MPNTKDFVNCIFSFTVLLNKINNCYMHATLANGPRDQGSIQARVIAKTQKMELDATLLNTQHYKV